MNKFFSFGLVGVALTLTGAGCFGGGTVSASGGIWQSTDSGKTWTATSAVPTATGVSSLSDTDITTFAIDPQDSSAVYAGSAANGMFYSLDGGLSWQRPEEPMANTGGIVAIAVSSKDVCTYFVAKSDRVMKTTDCGRTFNTGSYVESRAKETVTALSIDWYDSQTLWIGTTAGDVIRSVDGGASWTTMTRVDDRITSVAVSNADSRIVFVGTKTRGLSRTEDAGVTWVSQEKALSMYPASDRVSGFAQTKDGMTTIMNTQYGLLISKDKGATWSSVSLISAAGEVKVYAVAFAPEDGNTLYYTTDSTLNRSTSAGSAWTTSELPSSRVGSALLIDPTNAMHVYLGSMTVAKK